MTFLFSTVFLLFSLMVTDMGERILRQNVEDNMSIVVNQFDVYLQNYLGSIYDGFRSVESDQSLIQLRTISDEDSARPLRAARYVSLHKLITQLQEYPFLQVFTCVSCFSVAAQAARKAT